MNIFKLLLRSINTVLKAIRHLIVHLKKEANWRISDLFLNLQPIRLFLQMYYLVSIAVDKRLLVVVWRVQFLLYLRLYSLKTTDSSIIQYYTMVKNLEKRQETLAPHVT